MSTTARIGIALVWLSAVGCGPDAPQGPQEYHHSFVGNPEMPSGWQLIGSDSDRCVRFEPEGLRIALPPGHKGNANTGLSTFVSIQGDFEITVRYEVLAEPNPQELPGRTRFTMYVPIVGKGPSGPNRVTLSRAMTPRGAEYFPWMLLRDDETGEVRREGNDLPCRSKSGRLRLVRSGTKVTSWAAEGQGEDWMKLHEHAFSGADVKNIGLYAATGGPNARIDVRVLDLHVRAAGLENLPPAEKPARHNMWLVVAILVGLTALAVTSWRVARKRPAASRVA